MWTSELVKGERDAETLDLAGCFSAWVGAEFGERILVQIKEPLPCRWRPRTRQPSEWDWVGRWWIENNRWGWIQRSRWRVVRLLPLLWPERPVRTSWPFCVGQSRGSWTKRWRPRRTASPELNWLPRIERLLTGPSDNRMISFEMKVKFLIEFLDDI